MTSAAAKPSRPRDACSPAVDSGQPAPWWQRVPALPLGLTALFLSFEALPRVRENPTLATTIACVGAFLLAWTLVLWSGAKRWTQCFQIERAPLLRSHYVQATVQTCIYAYWGWYWRDVYAEIPLILSQFVFLYAFDGLLAWTRGRKWRIGCGPLPIILSTNVFIWFIDDWYVFQYLLIAVGALGKEFVKWNREGKRTHIFNPSAFTLALFSIVLIATNTTHLTRGVAIATTLALPPHIYLEIFLLGLVVQYFFAVTLMTFSAAVVLIALNAAYNSVTGTYYFVDTQLPIAIFLGLHLLMTDPSTSPRTNLGRAIFGGLYGLANFVLYLVFERVGIPEFYDKLLPVPILNLSVQVLDRFARSGWLGRLSSWEARFQPRKANLAYMGAWSALFLVMLTSGSVDAPHPGASIEFWKRAYADGKYDAGPRLLKLLGSAAEQGSPSAQNDLGVLHMQGKIVKEDHAAAAHYFTLACDGGDLDGCANVAKQFLFFREARSDADVARAFARLERCCTPGSTGGDGRACYLVGNAYETGQGRPQDGRRARELYAEACRRGSRDACLALERLKLASSD
jgi:hypothetical protein